MQDVVLPDSGPKDFWDQTIPAGQGAENGSKEQDGFVVFAAPNDSQGPPGAQNSPEGQDTSGNFSCRAEQDDVEYGSEASGDSSTFDRDGHVAVAGPNEEPMVMLDQHQQRGGYGEREYAHQETRNAPPVPAHGASSSGQHLASSTANNIAAPLVLVSFPDGKIKFHEDVAMRTFASPAYRGKKHLIFYIDTQGTFDLETERSTSLWIAGFSFLLADIQIVNLRSNIGGDNLHDIHTFTEVAAACSTKRSVEISQGDMTLISQLNKVIEAVKAECKKSYHENGEMLVDTCNKIVSFLEKDAPTLTTSVEVIKEANITVTVNRAFEMFQASLKGVTLDHFDDAVFTGKKNADRKLKESLPTKLLEEAKKGLAEKVEPAIKAKREELLKIESEKQALGKLDDIVLEWRKKIQMINKYEEAVELQESTEISESFARNFPNVGCKDQVSLLKNTLETRIANLRGQYLRQKLDETERQFRDFMMNQEAIRALQKMHANLLESAKDDGKKYCEERGVSALNEIATECLERLQKNRAAEEALKRAEEKLNEAVKFERYDTGNSVFESSQVRAASLTKWQENTTQLLRDAANTSSATERNKVDQAQGCFPVVAPSAPIRAAAPLRANDFQGTTAFGRISTDSVDLDPTALYMQPSSALEATKAKLEAVRSREVAGRKTPEQLAEEKSQLKEQQTHDEVTRKNERVHFFRRGAEVASPSQSRSSRADEQRLSEELEIILQKRLVPREDVDEYLNTFEHYSSNILRGWLERGIDEPKNDHAGSTSTLRKEFVMKGFDAWSRQKKTLNYKKLKAHYRHYLRKKLEEQVRVDAGYDVNPGIKATREIRSHFLKSLEKYDISDCLEQNLMDVTVQCWMELFTKTFANIGTPESKRQCLLHVLQALTLRIRDADFVEFERQVREEFQQRSTKSALSYGYYFRCGPDGGTVEPAYDALHYQYNQNIQMSGGHQPQMSSQPRVSPNPLPAQYPLPGSSSGIAQAANHVADHGMPGVRTNGMSAESVHHSEVTDHVRDPSNLFYHPF
ncbi:unnamed protein product, partial [Mesorhabditis spiculigera]